ncbi:MAG: radical SAM protein [Rikenellaceae bacterium]
MATHIFEDVIFGPIKSRRLGVSLGVNLMPVNGKLCNFDCVYCECGWNGANGGKLRHNSKAVVQEQLRERLTKMHADGDTLDVITFAGNGEPTLHPDFEEIIDSTISLRNELFPEAKVAVLSNATRVNNSSVRSALEKVDRAILKIDSASENTINLVNQPQFKYSLRAVIDSIKQFKGEVIIQTMFLKGESGGEKIDNTSEIEVAEWLKVLEELQPALVMIYSLDRDTPLDTLIKVNIDELNAIAEKVRNLGIECSAAG